MFTRLAGAPLIVRPETRVNHTAHRSPAFDRAYALIPKISTGEKFELVFPLKGYELYKRLRNTFVETERA